MTIIRHIFFTVVLVLVSLSAVAQVPELINNSKFRPDAKAAVDSIYNFNFDGAEELLSGWQQKYPDHPLWTLFEGMKFWWQVLSDLEDTSHDEQFYEMMKKANYQAGQLLHQNSTHADGLMIRAISNGYLARQYANREEWITSVNYGRKAMNAHEYLMELQPNLNDLKLAEGLKLYYSAYLPEAYPIVKTVSWFLPDGDKSKGLDLIREASQKAVFASAEATYFLGNINYNYEHDYDVSVHNFEKLHEAYPHNNYYVRILVKSYYKQYRFDAALQLIDKSLARWESRGLPYQKVLEEELWTWKGRILERRNETDKALEYYQKAFDRGKQLPNTKHRSFYVVSGYFAGKLLFEQGADEDAKRYLEQVLDAKTEAEYQRRARQLLNKYSD